LLAAYITVSICLSEAMIASSPPYRCYLVIHRKVTNKKTLPNG
jgi:hypothetical protein